MKNITLNINPNAVTSFSPPMPMLPPNAIASVPPKIITVAFSAQFDSELEALVFATCLIDTIKNYGN